MRAEFPKDETLHAIADRLLTLAMPVFVARRLKGNSAAPSATISQGSGCRGVHEYTMDVEIDDADDEEDDPRIEEEDFLNIMRDFARWIFEGIEDEYEYQMSDEAVDEAIIANGYTFDEDGERAD
ncbi:MAG TPA: hypothetical protein VFW94_23550 [Candidatus Acidoferrales bacterium]|nr:hypothetical protein [Candidatus Acidoferrales bacterium]